ncbi:MAG: uracil phosphoribosyltransferase, partial [Acidimicrobiia bacterium]
MPITIVEHPLARHHLTVLRDRATGAEEFRRTARRIAYLLVAEATSDVAVEEREIETPLESATGHRLAKGIVAVAVLRAGVGLLEAAVDLLPGVRVGYVGVERNEETAEPIEYYTKFPPMDDARVLVLEPMLATGGSLSWAVEKVKQAGARDITAVCVVAAPAGVEVLERDHPEVRIVAAALDRDLD